MKKFMLFPILALLPVAAVFASDDGRGNFYQRTVTDCRESAMRQELDRATFERRAVVTVVTCNQRAAAPQPRPAPVQRARVVTSGCNNCNQPIERVVDRQFFVRETREVLKPVVTYVPAGTYTTTRQVCESDLGCQ